MNTYDQIQSAVAAVRERTSIQPKVGIILGSGLGAFADSLENKVAIAYSDIPNFPTSSVAGHAGRLVIGTLAGAPIVAMQGRVHMYEGYTPQEVAFPARVLCSLGIDSLVVTNAAGGINGSFKAGDLMLIADHVNLSGRNPLVGPNDDRLGPRFPDMSTAYDPELCEILRKTAAKLETPLQEGVYVWLSGPTYETPAEIRMLRTLGIDAVGMSTVPETIVANHMGVRVAGISCITNLTAGISKVPLSHAEVSETANRVRDRFTNLLAHFLPAIAQVPRRAK